MAPVSPGCLVGALGFFASLLLDPLRLHQHLSRKQWALVRMLAQGGHKRRTDQVPAMLKRLQQFDPNLFVGDAVIVLVAGVRLVQHRLRVVHQVHHKIFKGSFFHGYSFNQKSHHSRH